MAKQQQEKIEKHISVEDISDGSGVLDLNKASLILPEMNASPNPNENKILEILQLALM